MGYGLPAGIGAKLVAVPFDDLQIAPAVGPEIIAGSTRLKAGTATKLALNISYNTANLGPQSEPTKIAGPVRRSLSFYFGLPKVTNSKETYSRPEIDQVF